MTTVDLLELFSDVADAVARAVAKVDERERRLRTGAKPGQYVLDLAADAAALDLLHKAPVAVVSEESGLSGARDAKITVVLDPVDGSTNCARRIDYWATSLCAMDSAGPVASLVVNHASGSRIVALRGGGSHRDGVKLTSSTVQRVEEAVVGLAGIPAKVLPWAQFRVLGCASLALCEVAAGGLDGYVDGGSWHAPWDYLGGLLACIEAGALVVDGEGRDLATADPTARRQLVAGSTSALLETLESATSAR